ncbi:murein biosynthesis integral membrane protein MurJ [Halalkalibacterium ligniniphilum]|uniref:murein biosynthesis integral membrane protein MurJ n=1 Tax=Halalkalibacterium ligniniphilum TaxID=1134413 RepID=UPI0003459EAC|nr:murein biosynthesis integral membrane protein MurJ [Halalkalibacterium ligniniphilum]
MKGKTLLKIIGAVAVINLASRFIGFLREVVIGYQFGTSSVADSVINAYTLPNFFYVALGGAITTAFISIYSKMGDPLRRDEFLKTVFTWLTVVLVGFTALLMVFSKPVMGLLFSGLEAEELALTSNLFTIMAPATFFLVIAMWFTGILNVNGRFSMATASTFVMNLVFVSIAVLFFPLLGPYAHAYGATISASVMVLMLVYMLKKGKFMNFGFRFKIDGEFKKMLRLALPILLGGATLQFYFLIHRVFASQLEGGVIAALNYSSKIVQLPQSVLMTAVTTVIYPLLAKKVAEQDNESIQHLYQKGLRMLVLTIVPATIFAYYYAEEIFQVVFEHGNFTRESTLLAAPLFQLLVLSMFAHSANLYVTRFFYAKEHSVLPVSLSVISVFGINVGLIVLLMDRFGAMGIAAATSISAIVNFLLLLVAAKFVLKLKLVGANTKRTVAKFVILFAALIGVQIGIEAWFPADMALLKLIVALIVTGLVFIGLLAGLRFSEMEDIRKKLTKRIVKRG